MNAGHDMKKNRSERQASLNNRPFTVGGLSHNWLILQVMDRGHSQVVNLFPQRVGLLHLSDQCAWMSIKSIHFPMNSIDVQWMSINVHQRPSMSNECPMNVLPIAGLSPFLLTRLQKTQRQNSGPTGMTSSQLGEIQLLGHDLRKHGFLGTEIPYPIGSMVLAYMLTWPGYIDGINFVNVTIYSIHGSYGYGNLGKSWDF